MPFFSSEGLIVCSDVGIYDRVVVQDLIKEIAQTQQIDASAAKNFKVVVINEGDTLSKDAQHALRRTMEKFTGNLRVIISCTSLSKIIPPVRSRCLLVRVAAPTPDEVKLVLHQVARKEGVVLPDELAGRIAAAADGNLRKSLLCLEAMKARQ